MAAAAAASGQLKSIATLLAVCNEATMTSSGETTTKAETRASVFDLTFLLIIHMVKMYGKDVVLRFLNNSGASTPYLSKWLQMMWPNDKNQYQTAGAGSLEVDSARVESLIQVLRTAPEFKPSMTKWNDICNNIPQALMEMVYAKQKGIITLPELNRACILIRDYCPTCVTISVIAVLSKATRLTSNLNEHIQLLKMLAETSFVQMSSSNTLYKERFLLFESCLPSLIGDLLPPTETQEKGNYNIQCTSLFTNSQGADKFSS